MDSHPASEIVKAPFVVRETCKILSGLAWTIAYLLIIWKGFEDQTCGMPLLALTANLAWEFVFSFIYPHRSVQRWVNRVWLAFDLVILAQYIRYGSWPFPWVAGLTLVCIAGMIASVHLFQDRQGKYTAFGQNVLMSALFLLKLQGGTAGQSAWIALAKLLGSAIPTVGYVLFYPPQARLYVFITGTVIFLLDSAYLWSLLTIA